MMPDQTSEKAEVKMYSDFKSPYAYLAFDPGMALGQRFDVRVRWIPFQLRLKGKGERSVYAEYKVKYSYMDARRWAKPRGLWDLVSFTTASREPLSGTLRMGTIPTVGPFLLPRVLPSLRQAYSRLRLYLVEDLTERLIESLHRGELDVVLLALPYDCGAGETVIPFADPLRGGITARPPPRQGETRQTRAFSAEGWSLPTRPRACSLPSRRPASHRGLRGDEPSDIGADGRQRSRHHLVANTRSRCRLASGHKPRYPTVAHQRSGTKDWSRLAPRHWAPE
jgi:LysR substrate binding domain